MKKKRFPVIELFVLLFGLLLLNGSDGFNSFYDFKSISWVDSKYGSNEVVKIISIDDIKNNGIKPGVRVSVDTTIVSTRFEEDGYTIVGLAELGDNVNTTIKFRTFDYNVYTKLSQTSATVKLELLLDGVNLSESTSNLAVFEEDYIPVTHTELLLTGKLTGYSFL
ncbi:MAG: hypothetical protein SCALA702_08380 [Melioribacteraceae bacterium]|nr:MAG: hypothetical protein SCALA702_08380 [Melioribacteraceae bacterium]